ncbi:MAG: peptidase [Actinomycetota bacterium]
MTFCLGMKVREGLIGIADTRITAGSQTLQARKITVIDDGNQSILLMTSGLRSVRDKVLTYFEEVLEERTTGFDKLYQAANALAEQVRRVAAEDRLALAETNLQFDLNCLIGGKLPGDKEHKLYMLYPQANWVEVGTGTPYCILGETAYGKPLLDRVLRFESTLEEAMKIGFVAFDSTRRSTAAAGFPMDVVLFRPELQQMSTCRFTHEDMADFSDRWTYGLRRLIERMPADWLETLVAEEVSNVTMLNPPGPDP